MKICSKCKEEKPLDNFSKNKTKSDGFNSTCKCCNKKYHLLNKDIKNNKSKEWRKNNPGYHKKWYNDNIDSNKLYQKEYDLVNKDKKKEYMNVYTQQNRKEIIKRTDKWKKDKYYSDPQYKLLSILRVRLYEMLKINKVGKSKNALALLGCEIQECKQHLESQFLPEMNWENHGNIWEIDHIKPCSLFDLTNQDEQKQCFHYTNLQPLFKTTKIAESYGYIGYIGNRDKSNK